MKAECFQSRRTQRDSDSEIDLERKRGMKYAKLTGVKNVIVLSGNTHPQLRQIRVVEDQGFPGSFQVSGGDPFVFRYLCGEIRTVTNPCGVAREKDIGQSLFCIQPSRCCFVMG